MYIEKDTIAYDEFVVLDEDNNPITGLISSNFTTKLYDPNKNEVSNISAGITVTIEELGDGSYRVSFTPDTLGAWILIVYNDTYFPFGKGNNYVCVESLGGDGGAGLPQQYKDMIKRILGLSQENYRLFNPQFDRNNNLIAGTIKIYSSANDVDTDTNPLAEYEITAAFNLRTNLMTTYKVKKKP